MADSDMKTLDMTATCLAVTEYRHTGVLVQDVQIDIWKIEKTHSGQEHK